ncbi:hypothetical protein CPC08DRAFT_660221 [Agrocybe pediades]|nr:hypothetical protein CPC08DRAFT_660221 [Agrocybe pediades]
MCHNVIDGRYHPECGHFYAMATRKQDCYRNNCLFSERHMAGCASSACIRMMAPPAHNPIRLSPTVCAECNLRAREQPAGNPGTKPFAVRGR